jgi:MFS family permease
VTEISGPRFSNIAQSFLILIWALSQVFLGIVLPFFSYWRVAFLVILVLPIACTTLMISLLIYESPRYLYSQGKYEEAKTVLRYIASINKRPPFTFKLIGEVKQYNSNYFCLMKAEKDNKQDDNLWLNHT